MDTRNLPAGHKEDPRWYTGEEIAAYLPLMWRDWLTDEGSLTQRLTCAFASEPVVDVLSQTTGCPDPDELTEPVLSGARPPVVVRRSRLLLQNEPVVYARCIFPGNQKLPGNRQPEQLGSTPLRKWLFPGDELVRGPFKIARVQSDTLDPDSGAQPGHLLWARRSAFLLNNRCFLLLTEYFLCPLPQKNLSHWNTA